MQNLGQVRAHARAGTGLPIDEANVVAAAMTAFAGAAGREVSVGEIARRFNEAGESEQFRPARWIGYVLRTRLRLKTLKSRGLFVVPAKERAKLEALAHRYRI